MLAGRAVAVSNNRAAQPRLCLLAWTVSAGSQLPAACQASLPGQCICHCMCLCCFYIAVWRLQAGHGLSCTARHPVPIAHASPQHSLRSGRCPGHPPCAKSIGLLRQPCTLPLLCESLSKCLNGPVLTGMPWQQEMARCTGSVMAYSQLATHALCGVQSRNSSTDNTDPG